MTQYSTCFTAWSCKPHPTGLLREVSNELPLFPQISPLFSETVLCRSWSLERFSRKPSTNRQGRVENHLSPGVHSILPPQPPRCCLERISHASKEHHQLQHHHHRHKHQLLLPEQQARLELMRGQVMPSTSPLINCPLGNE